MTAGVPPSRGLATTQRPPHGGRWRVRGRELDLDHPLVMGILNVTPDSFSDGGRFIARDDAVAHAGVMLEAGADIVDVGGESTRPQGAQRVSPQAEHDRVIPVIDGIARRFPDAVISVDTMKSDVAAAAIDAGAHIVNDVSGFRADARMAQVCGTARCGVVLMHSRGDVSTMATFEHAVYDDDVVGGVERELAASLRMAREAGIAEECIVVDPGVGFAKRSAQSLAVLGGLPRLARLGRPLLVGVSRKRFIGELTGQRDAMERKDGTTGGNVAALMLGARIFRVHDVRAAREALDVAWAVLQAAERHDSPTGIATE